MISAAHHGMMMASTDDMSFVEYLESSGTQYIDTGIKQAADIEIQAEYMPVGTAVQWGTYFGCGYQDNSAYNILGRHYATTPTRFNAWFANSTYAECYIDVSTSSKIRVTLKSGSCTAGGTTGTITSVTSGLATSYNMYLFSANKDNVPWRSQPCRIYSFKVLKVGKDKEVIMDLVPVKKNGVGYMLDRVTWKLFGNDGTGSFKTGGKIYDAEVEYIESTGTQYVDTGFDSVSSHSFKIAMNFALVKRRDPSENNYLFCCNNTSSWLSCEIDRNSPYRAYANVGSKTLIYCGPSPYPFNVWDTFTFSANPSSQQYSITGEGGGWSTSGSFTGSLPNGRIRLLISRSSGVKSLVKLKHVEIWDNDTLVRDLISVRIGTDGYLYDRVSGQLFGQGDLLVGSDVPTVKCAVFDGTVNSRIKSAAIASDPVQQPDISMSGWIKFDSLSDVSTRAISFVDRASNKNTGPQFGPTSDGGIGIIFQWVTDFGKTPIGDQSGSWHHYAFSFGGGTMNLYFDGVLKLTGSATSWLRGNASANPVLGMPADASAAAGATTTKCKIANVNLFNYALSASEIASMARSPFIVPKTAYHQYLFIDQDGTDTGTSSDKKNLTIGSTTTFEQIVV